MRLFVRRDIKLQLPVSDLLSFRLPLGAQADQEYEHAQAIVERFAVQHDR